LIDETSGKSDSIGVADWSFDEHMTGKVRQRIANTLPTLLFRRMLTLPLSSFLSHQYAVPTGNASMPYQVMLEGNFWPSISVYSKEHAGGNW